MISSHILDTSLGVPAKSINVKLCILAEDQWKEIGSGETNADGRVSFSSTIKEGTYQLLFDVEHYFKNQDSFYKKIPVVFHLTDTQRKYHVPLLLNPFGYSTYRGS